MKKGALTNYVKEKFGKKGFTKDGDIRVSVLKDLKENGSPVTKKRANYALNMRRKKHGKKGKRKGKKNRK